jgi:Enoyl-(Acyl carrier protein) reductase
MTLPAEATGAAPGRGRLTGRRVLVVGAGTRPSLGREASRLNPGRTARRLPFGRQATAWEVAYATVWLLSGESSYVNAHPLVLDGGATSFG